ncbi:MAG: Hint domain-containing protein [Methanomicrobiales archaeon]|nr:Hint domain-containing protein [Methanomicrobiales archaeon]
MKPGYILLLVSAILLAGCTVPGGGPPPTPTPTPGGPLSPAQLKYLLLDHYSENQFFYCDPDYYPVGRGDEPERAIAAFPGIEKETDVLAAIITRKGLQPPYSNDTKLVIYREYKKLNAIPLTPTSADTYSFSLQLGDMVTGRRVAGSIRSDGVILSERSETAVLTCPICLAGDTLIDTPSGQIPVRDIRAGMFVITADRNGAWRAAPVLQADKTPVSPGHRIVRLRLSDGRELSASPGHPLRDGRPVGTLAVGDEVDGASVTGADSLPFTGDYTYDILPAGDTGSYRANGIPLGSTLFPGAAGNGISSRAIHLSANKNDLSS